MSLGESYAAAGGAELVTTKGQVIDEGIPGPGLGDASSLNLTAPIVGILVGGPNQNRFQLAAADGGVFTYGLPFSGSAAGDHLVAPIVGEQFGALEGYYLVAADGGVFTFGGATFYGSAAGDHLTAPVVGMSLRTG